jgi:hypothetical protein
MEHISKKCGLSNLDLKDPLTISSEMNKFCVLVFHVNVTTHPENSVFEIELDKLLLTHFLYVFVENIQEIANLIRSLITHATLWDSSATIPLARSRLKSLLRWQTTPSAALTNSPSCKVFTTFSSAISVSPR